MSESKRFGPVQVKFNDDGTLAIYQPDSNRVLSAELAQALVAWLNDNGNLIHPGLESDYYAAIPEPTAEEKARAAARMKEIRELAERQAAERQSTVGGGVISTSDGPADGLTATELEADKNAADARNTLNQMTAEAAADGLYGKADEFVDTRPAPPVKRRPGRPRKQP